MFREIGFADDLGSGVCNTAHYLKLYSGKDPLFEEGDIFRVTIPLIPENLLQGIGFTIKCQQVFSTPSPLRVKLPR